MSTIEVPQEKMDATTAETTDVNPIDAPISAEQSYVDMQPDNEFNYKPVTPLAPIALFFGLCSAAGFLAWEALAISGMGVLMGLVAIWKIRSGGGEVGGSTLAKIGLALSTICLIGGASSLTYQYIAELPEGHQRISFSWFARQKPEVVDGELKINEEIQALDGQDIFIKGYMYPGRKTEGITEFVLVKDSGDCCFGGQPKLEDMILVTLQNDQKVDLRAQTTPIGIGGKLRLDDRARVSDGLRPLYSLEGYHIR